MATGISGSLNRQSNASFELLEVNDGYILYKKYDNGCSIIKLSIDGIIIQDKGIGEILGSEYVSYDDGGGCSTSAWPIVATKNSSGNVFFSRFGCSNTTGIQILDSNLNKIEEIVYPYSSTRELLAKPYVVNKMITLDTGYLISGENMVLLDEKGEIKKIYSKTTLDVERIGNYIYTYEVNRAGDDYLNSYNTSIVINKISEIELPLSFYNEWISSGSGMTSGFARLKNRVVYYEQDNTVSSIILNTPILITSYGRDPVLATEILKNWKNVIGSSFFMVGNSSYGVASYRLNDSSDASNDDSSNNISGIISNIIKNPQTNSIIIIIVFVVLILSISITSSFIYKKKIKKEEIK